jgi:hypothetical protein
MAAPGGIEAELGPLPIELKRIFTNVFRAFLPNLRFGPMDTAKAENFAAYKLTSTTAASTAEFSIAHGMGRTPYLILPALDLTAVGSKFVPLEVSRAADSQRIYLKSSVTSTPFSMYVE